MTQGTFTKTPGEGIAFIEIYVLPTLAIARKLQEQKKIISGGPMAGKIGFAFIIQAKPAQETDDLLEGLPMWPGMATTVTPLTTFEGREISVKQRIEAIKKRMTERKAQQ